MTESRLFLSLVIVAGRAIASFLTLGLAGRRLGYFPITEGVRKLFYKIVLIIRAAMAGIKRISLSRTGRRSNKRSIAMSGSRKHVADIVIAGSTITSFLTVSHAGGALYGVPITIRVRKHTRVGILIGMSTRAGIKGISKLSTGRLNNHRGIMMAIRRCLL